MKTWNETAATFNFHGSAQCSVSCNLHAWFHLCRHVSVNNTETRKRVVVGDFKPPEIFDLVYWRKLIMDVLVQKDLYGRPFFIVDEKSTMKKNIEIDSVFRGIMMFLALSIFGYRWRETKTDLPLPWCYYLSLIEITHTALCKLSRLQTLLMFSWTHFDQSFCDNLLPVYCRSYMQHWWRFPKAPLPWGRGRKTTLRPARRQRLQRRSRIGTNRLLSFSKQWS